jgi:hypothetical protein
MAGRRSGASCRLPTPAQSGRRSGDLGRVLSQLRKEVGRYVNYQSDEGPDVVAAA